MKAYKIIPSSKFKRMPWKNGLGETLEIARFEDEQGVKFRISQASVIEDGAFSDFSGMLRTLVLLSGKGVSLLHSSTQRHELENPLDMAYFLGGEQTTAELYNGPIEDLNIMVREGSCKASVSAISSVTHLCSHASEQILFKGIYAVNHCIMKGLACDTEHTLEAGSLLQLDAGESYELDWLAGQAILIEIAENAPK